MANAKKLETYPVRVLIREIGYYAEVPDELGNNRIVVKTSYGPNNPQSRVLEDLGDNPDTESTEYKDAIDQVQRGEIAYLLERDYLRLKRAGAVVDVGEEPPIVGVDEEVLNPYTATVEELTEWIETEKPKVNDVVNASGGEPDVARKLLEAESKATDGNPREGVVKGLTAVVSRG